MQLSDSSRIKEIAAVFATAIGKFVFMDLLNWRLSFIVVAILGWAFYVIDQSKRKKGILNYWGFRKDNFKSAFKLVMPFGIISVLIFIIIGIFQSTINLTWHLIPILLLYPIWGVIQQFLVISLIAGNLKDLNSFKFSKPIIILITALLFSLLHYPIIWLMIGTFILAIFYSIIFLKQKNIWVLGLFHGWLGALFYYLVVGSDPFMQVFGKFLN